MAFIPIEDVVQVMLNFTTNLSTVAQNRFYVLPADAIDDALLEAACALFANWWEDNYSVGAASTWNLASVVARDMTIESGREVVYTTDLPVPGQGLTGQDAFSVSGTVTWLTGYVGRSFRGRTYLVGVSANNVVGNHLHPDFVAGMQTQFDALIENCNDGEMPLQVVSLYHDGAPRAAGLIRPVTSCRMNSKIATQRRRLD